VTVADDRGDAEPGVASPSGNGLPPAPSTHRSLGDGGAVALAVVTCVGAVDARPLPLALGGGALVLALGLRRPSLLLLSGLLLASTMGARAVSGLAPAQPADFTGTVTLVGDPRDRFGSTVADVRVDGRRLELRARSGGRGELLTRLAGERVAVRGRIRPPPAGSSWLAQRHIVGYLDVDSVRSAGPGSPPWRAANRIRRLLVDGAESLSPDRRALFTGFVLGDDRDQSAAVTDDFRGSGLTHLLAVSGENIT